MKPSCNGKSAGADRASEENSLKHTSGGDLKVYLGALGGMHMYKQITSYTSSIKNM